MIEVGHEGNARVTGITVDDATWDAVAKVERLRRPSATAVAWMVTHHQDKKPNVSVYCVGGPYPDPKAKAEFIAKMYGGTVTPLAPITPNQQENE